MSFYTVTVAPTEPAVSLEDAKCFMRVNTESEDTLITALVQAAQNEGESYNNRSFVPRTIVGVFDCLESTRREVYPFITLQTSPLISVDKVEVFSCGAFVELTPGTDYKIRINEGFSRVLFMSTVVPDADEPQPYQITFQAGYGTSGGDASAVPDEVKTAIKSHTLFLYENRGDVVPDGKVPMPIEVVALYNTFRIINQYG